MENFDLIVIGGGPGGYNAAGYARSFGLSVALFEKNELGGVCLNEGCVPSKTLLNSAKVYTYVKHSENYGVDVSDKGAVNQQAVIDRKNKVVKRLVTGVKSKMKVAGVSVFKSEAKILKKDGDLYKITDGENEYLSKYLIIATGSSAFIPPIDGMKEGIENGFVLTNREILNLTEIPARLAVIGGGVIGLEMADYFTQVGSEVTVIEMLDKIAGPTEAKISTILQKALEKKGVKFYLSTKVVKVEVGKVFYENADGAGVVECDKALVSVGRRANSADIGLENIGVSVEKGRIITDDNLKTNVDGVYAIGDVNGKIMLAHTAYREGEVAVNNIVGKGDIMNYNTIPSVIYTTPEVASVGFTKEVALNLGINAEEKEISLMYSGRYIAENTDYTGIIKIVYNKDTNKLIGAHIIGSYASEYIVAVSELIDLEVDIERIKKIVFPHPTVSEVVREAIFEI